ncbi:MAG: DHH family phosphoesterase [Candidatus Hadarchaeales archaeon]
MQSDIQNAVEMIRRNRKKSIEIISHMDADGVCAAAVLSKALDRLSIPHEVKFVKMLYRNVIKEMEPADLTIFLDLGSSQLKNLKEKFSGKKVIIADHHEPEMAGGWQDLVHLNAPAHGIDGVQEISGAGLAYLIAKELDASNRDLASLAIVGAIGDIQNAWGTLIGKNRQIAEDAISAGVVERSTDILFYGRHSRPIFKSLETFTDPPIPGISNSPLGCMSLLKELQIPVKKDGRYRRPVDLTADEKQRLASELIARAYSSVPPEFYQYVPGLIVGENYSLKNEPENSPLKDVEEFSTCMNSTARHEQPLIGFEVAKGNRTTYMRAMFNLIKYHRREIAVGLEFVEENGLNSGPRGYLQFFDATGVVKEMFVGTIASLALGYQCAEPFRPVAGVVREEGVAKVSARCSRLLFLKGLDLGKAIKEAANSVGGEGGGHAVACGAQIAEDAVPEFLERFETLLLQQRNVNA